MDEEKGLYTIFHAVVGFFLGGAGLIGAIVWYHSLSTSNGASAAGMYLGAVILGIFCLLVLIWSSVIILAFWRARDKEEDLP
jgi:hypothetical protein